MAKDNERPRPLLSYMHVNSICLDDAVPDALTLSIRVLNG